MSVGSLILQKSVMDFALFGLGAYHLYYEDEKGKEQRVLRARRHMPARQCRACGTLVARPATD